MDSLIIMVDPTPTGSSFDLIFAKLVEPNSYENLGRPDVYEVRYAIDVISRFVNLQPDQVFNRIEGLVKTPLTNLANKLETTLKTNRKKGHQP